MPIPPKLQSVLETLELVPERSDRIQFLISLAEGFHSPPPEVVAKPYPEEFRVPGCESEAFVFSRPRADGTLDFYFAVENPQGVSAMALAAILRESFTGANREDILSVPEDVIYQVFGKELSMGKSMGLMGMVQMAKMQARKGPH